MARRPAPLTVPLALALALAVPVGARAEEDASPDERYSVRAELGPELDTNAHRTEIIEVPGVINPGRVISPLARGVLSATLSDVVGGRHQVALSATLAAKVFANSAARDEDVGIAESTLVWRAALGGRAALVMAGAYYEAFQRDLGPPEYGVYRRDFRSITPTLRLALGLGPRGELGLSGGSRVFVFKPDRSFDFQAPTASVDFRWVQETADGSADWEAAFRTAYERRAFDSLALVPATTLCPTNPYCPPTSGTAMRVDDFLTSGIDIARTGRVLLSGGYSLHLNLSNSYGETVLRHFIVLRFAASLPFDLYLAARAEIVFARYAEQVFVAVTQMNPGRPYVSIDDENRNIARVELSRGITDRVQLVARYTFYANELRTGSDVSYRRHTGLISVAYTLEK